MWLIVEKAAEQGWIVRRNPGAPHLAASVDRAFGSSEALLEWLSKEVLEAENPQVSVSEGLDCGRFMR